MIERDMDIASIETSLHPVFVFILLTLAAYRLQRIVTADTWPPSAWFRDWVDDRFGPTSSWSEFFHCPHCLGFWTSLAVFAEHFLLGAVPIEVYMAIAAAGVISLAHDFMD